jgi:hypothetical protein
VLTLASSWVRGSAGSGPTIASNTRTASSTVLAMGPAAYALEAAPKVTQKASAALARFAQHSTAHHSTAQCSAAAQLTPTCVPIQAQRHHARAAGEAQGGAQPNQGSVAGGAPHAVACVSPQCCHSEACRCRRRRAAAAACRGVAQVVGIPHDPRHAAGQAAVRGVVC